MTATTRTQYPGYGGSKFALSSYHRERECLSASIELLYVKLTVVHRHAREIASACVSVCVWGGGGGGVGGGGETLSSRV